MKRAFFAMVLLTLVSATPALSISADEMFDDPAKEARARDIGRQLRCLVCQNESIFDSNADLAKDLRIIVRERIAAGDTDAEIIEFVRSRFGDYVLLSPPVNAQTMPLWLAPVGFLLVGAMGVGAYIRSRRPSASRMPDLTETERAEAQMLLQQEEPQ